jgi:histidine triad (HIT) family protein
MSTVFTKILQGEIPGRFVYQDDRCAAFLSIAPLQPGHTLVVPRQEIDHWIDLDADLAAWCMKVARRIGRAQMRAFHPRRIGLMIAGMEVPHTHLHVVPIREERELDFARADSGALPDDLDRAAQALREALEAEPGP